MFSVISKTNDALHELQLCKLYKRRLSKISVQPTRIQCLSMINEVYKFIQNTAGRYVQTYTKTKLHTCIINKHTYQGQFRIKYLPKYRSKLHYFTS